jgi:uncharacterized phiE125 gp8 family phage protein
MPLVDLTQRSDPPVTLDEAKDQCRIVCSDYTHDSRLLRLVDEATRSIETLTGARLAAHSVQLVLDGFPEWDLDLGVYPVNSITSVKYDDADNVEQTLVLGTDYWEGLSGMYPFIRPISGWPPTMYDKPGSVRIVMDVGYYNYTVSPAMPSTPDDLRHAVLIRVKEYFDNAGESITGHTMTPTVSAVKALTDMHRRITV